MMLVTRNPNVRSIADFTEVDRIAVPNTKAASQIILLQMMLEKQFGEGSHNKLNPLLVQLGHPEAVQALSNPRHEVNSHLSAPPYQDEELKMPGVHKVVTLTDVTGGPATNTVVFSSDKFARANPKIMQAFVAALDEANEFIRTNPREAAELYLAATKEKSSVDELTAFLRNPSTGFSTAPAGALKTAQFMYKIGISKKQASDWRDLFFAELHGRAGD
jgi:NitT/TauT family transport system substrate-binding protein